MSFNFYSSRWYNFMTSWKYWDATSADNDSEIFSNNNTQDALTFFLLSLYCYNSCMSQFSLPMLWLQVYHICYLCMLHQRSDWSLLILDNKFPDFPIPLILFCLCHWCGQIKLPHVDYWFYQVIEWFPFQVEILSTPLYQIFLIFVL